MTPPRYLTTADCGWKAGKTVVGFGNDDFCVMEIDRRVARFIIRARHYSGRVVQNSTLHLGVFIDGMQVGVLQFGYALNPSSCARIVTGTKNDQYLELNRMWLSDAAPRNSESRSIAYAARYIRRTRPRVMWIQSFADERCGGLGVVYQAAGFDYVGCHVSQFYELDGQIFHKITATAKRGKGCTAEEMLRERRCDVVVHEYRQFRYIRFLAPWWKHRLRLPVLPFPKRDAPRQWDAPGTTGNEPRSIRGGGSTACSTTRKRVR